MSTFAHDDSGQVSNEELARILAAVQPGLEELWREAYERVNRGSPTNWSELTQPAVGRLRATLVELGTPLWLREVVILYVLQDVLKELLELRERMSSQRRRN
jgi:hypothetical protein